MALHFALKITNHTIGQLYAQRIEGTTDPDSIGVYDADIVRTSAFGDDDDDDSLPRLLWAGQVTHRYGDGAWALVARIIAAAGLDHSADGGGFGGAGDPTTEEEARG